jgi:hypothetical protein
MAFAKQTFLPHPEGQCVLTIKQIQGVKGKYGPQQQVSFDSDQLMDEGPHQGEPFRVSYWIDKTNVGAKNATGRLLVACGVDIESDEELEELEIEDLIGRKVGAFIEHFDKDGGGTGHRILKLMPHKKRRESAKKAADDENDGYE